MLISSTTSKCMYEDNLVLLKWYFSPMLKRSKQSCKSVKYTLLFLIITQINLIATKNSIHPLLKLIIIIFLPYFLLLITFTFLLYYKMIYQYVCWHNFQLNNNNPYINSNRWRCKGSYLHRNSDLCNFLCLNRERTSLQEVPREINSKRKTTSLLFQNFRSKLRFCKGNWISELALMIKLNWILRIQISWLKIRIN